MREVGDVAPRALEVGRVLRQQGVELDHQRPDLGRLFDGHAFAAASPHFSQGARRKRSSGRSPSRTWSTMASTSATPSAANDRASVAMASRHGPITASRGADAMRVAGMPETDRDWTRK